MDARPDMIEARQNTASDWPAREASAYVDWWKQAEYRSGTRSAGPGDDATALGTALRFVRFAPAAAGPSGASARFRPEWTAAPDAVAPATAARSVPMWPGALPTGWADPDDGLTLATPGEGEFGQPLGPVGQCPPAVMVVIDTQINPLQAQFLDGAGGPRIAAHWLMEGMWRPDARVPYGRELRRDELAAAQRLTTEDAGLRALGVASLAEPFASRGAMQPEAHGTHVLGLAAGTDPQDRSAAAQALRGVPILAVSLPSNQLLSASGVFLDVFVDQALEWISVRLVELFGPEPPPVVVNLSYGLAAGPKDGTGAINLRLRDWLSAHPEARLFMPAGNDGLAQGHAVLDLAEDRSATGWLVPPADPLSTFAEVWFAHADDGTRLQLAPPGKASALSLPLEPGRVFDLVEGSDPAGRAVGRVYVLPGQSPFRQVGCLICLGPTRPRCPGSAAAPAGVWGVGVIGPGDLQVTVDLQSERSLSPHSRASPAARLLQRSEADAAPQRAGTLNAIGPGTGAVMVNGTDLSVLRHLTPTGEGPDPAALARWTSRGDPFGTPPSADGDFFPADRSKARPGLLAPGYRSGSTAVVQGTSFSTALATRAALAALIAPETT